MNVLKTLGRIEELSYKMIESPTEIEKAIIYATIKTLVDEIDSEIQENQKNGWGYVYEKLGELTWHVQSMAHLDDGNGHDDDKHYVWLLGSLGTIKKNIEKI